MALRKIQWTVGAWEDYIYWQTHDIKMLKRINVLIKDILRTPFEGLGKPEALKEKLSGLWSRRINDEHRLVYLVEYESIIIFECKGHYSNK